MNKYIFHPYAFSGIPIPIVLFWVILLGLVVVLAVTFTSLCFSSTCAKYPFFLFPWVIWYVIQNITQTKIIPAVMKKHIMIIIADT